MTTKDIVLQSIRDLPDTVSWAEIEDRIRFLAAIEKGLDDIKAGRTVPHEDVKASLEQWLSS